MSVSCKICVPAISFVCLCCIHAIFRCPMCKPNLRSHMVSTAWIILLPFTCTKGVNPISNLCNLVGLSFYIASRVNVTTYNYFHICLEWATKMQHMTSYLEWMECLVGGCKHVYITYQCLLVRGWTIWSGWFLQTGWTIDTEWPKLDSAYFYDHIFHQFDQLFINRMGCLRLT